MLSYPCYLRIRKILTWRQSQSLASCVLLEYFRGFFILEFELSGCSRCLSPIGSSGRFLGVALCFLCAEFCHGTGLESICVSITCCLLLYSLAKLLLRVPQLGWFSASGRTVQQESIHSAVLPLLTMDG